MKQIEEMAKVIRSSMDNLGCGNFNFTGDEISTMFAKALYNAGYRKQSEVAEEIFAEIESLEAENRGFSICLDSAVKTALKIKCEAIEAIKEFDKKFKRASDLICTGSLGSGAVDIKNYYRISFDSYEKLIQEMTEKAAHDE